MNESRKKVLAVVLGLGITAIVMDRFVFGYATTGPSAAVAIPFQELSGVEVASSASEAIQDGDVQSTDVVTLANRLDSIAQEQQLCLSTVPNALQLPSGWGVSRRPGSVVTQLHPIEAFLSNHQLEAVVATHSGGCVIIGGQTIHVADQLDGFKLESVGQRSAVFVAGDQRVKLNLDPDQTNR